MTLDETTILEDLLYLLWITAGEGGGKVTNAVNVSLLTQTPPQPPLSRRPHLPETGMIDLRPMLKFCQQCFRGV